MKRYIFPLLLAVLLPGVGKTFAQTVTHGTFKAPAANSPAIRMVDVNYTMIVSPGKDKMTIETKSNEAVLFNMDVMGSDSKVLAHWSQRSSKTASASHDFDLSALPSGSYHVNINNHNATNTLPTRAAGNGHNDASAAAHTGSIGNNSSATASASKSAQNISFSK